MCVCVRLSVFAGVGGGNDFQWCFSQVKGAVDEDVAEGKARSTCMKIQPSLLAN